MAEKINVTFLGTGATVPTANKNHPAMLLSYKEHNFLFDCGEGTQRQFRKAKENPMKVDTICITHWHADHILGLPGLLQTMDMNGYTGTLEIHGPKGTKKQVAMILENFVGSTLKKNLDYKFTINAVEHLRGVVFENDEILVSTFELKHGTPAIGYSFEIKEKLRIDKGKLAKLKLKSSPELKKLVEGKDVTIDSKKVKYKDVTYLEKGRKVCYVLDTMYTKDIEKHVKDADLLVIEATFQNEDAANAKEHMHLTAHDAGTIAKNAKVKMLALIHLSQRYERASKKTKDEAKEVFDGNIIIPKDLDKIVL